MALTEVISEPHTYVHILGPKKLGEYETQNAKMRKGEKGGVAKDKITDNDNYKDKNAKKLSGGQQADDVPPPLQPYSLGRRGMMRTMMTLHARLQIRTTNI